MAAGSRKAERRKHLTAAVFWFLKLAHGSSNAHQTVSLNLLSTNSRPTDLWTSGVSWASDVDELHTTSHGNNRA